jgi:hypothetical protein
MLGAGRAKRGSALQQRVVAAGGLEPPTYRV